MAKKQTQKKNGGRKRQGQPQQQLTSFKLERQGTGTAGVPVPEAQAQAPVQASQAQGAVAAGALDAFEPEREVQGAVPSEAVTEEATAPIQDTQAQKAEGHAVAGGIVSFVLPRRREKQEWESILVRVSPRVRLALQRLADAANMPVAAYCRAILESAVQHAEAAGKA